MIDVTLTRHDDHYTLRHPPADDYEIFGRGGNDVIDIDALQGTFYISGGSGNDTIMTGLTGSHATFEVDGGSGNDTIIGVGGTNHFDGGSGNDTLSGAFGTFWLEGGAGDDTLSLGSFATGVLEGGSGNDVLTGNAQRSSFVMYGGSGNDRLQAVGNFSHIHEEFYGDSGNDTITSLGGDDLLDGGEGNDVLRGGDGSDTLWGGDGRDVFVFGNRTEGGTVAFRDVIEDFERGDKIQFVGTGLTFAKLTITDGVDGAEIRYTDNARIVDTIVLVDVEANELRAADFAFV